MSPSETPAYTRSTAHAHCASHACVALRAARVSRPLSRAKKSSPRKFARVSPQVRAGFVCWDGHRAAPSASQPSASQRARSPARKAGTKSLPPHPFPRSELAHRGAIFRRVLALRNSAQDRCVPAHFLAQNWHTAAQSSGACSHPATRHKIAAYPAHSPHNWRTAAQISRV
jgi:hypothetical protein